MGKHEYAAGDIRAMADVIDAVDSETAGTPGHDIPEVTWDMLHKAQPALERAARAIAVLELYEQDRELRGRHDDVATELMLARHAISAALGYVR